MKYYKKKQPKETLKLENAAFFGFLHVKIYFATNWQTWQKSQALENEENDLEAGAI